MYLLAICSNFSLCERVMLVNGKNYICTKFVRSQKFCREMNCDVLPEECCNQWGFFFFLGIFVCNQSGYHP
jgi:hypothetical protein